MSLQTPITIVWLELTTAGRLKNWDGDPVMHEFALERADSMVELAQAFGYCGA